ncbi:hypothetical protein BKA70DRAFT_331355 [Coprinopsis sp. MPI-PUGE-AT-0042]|nr:hypothetical protein BKA70DRAFT_331355 [Coprinopsis sp. MPI-PUGE-AT-0042]
MHPPSASTTSLIPDFPGAYPATPRRRNTTRRGLQLDSDYPFSPMSDEDVQSEEHRTVEILSTSSRSECGMSIPRASTPCSIFFNQRHDMGYGGRTDEHSSSLGTYGSSDTSGDDVASEITEYSATYESTISVASATMASTSRSFPPSLNDNPDVREAPRDARVLERRIRELTSRSSLNLSVDLVGLPSVQKLRGNSGGNDESGNQNLIAPAFGVDLSCLPQPDGRGAWTLALGVSSIPRGSSEEPSSNPTLSPLAVGQGIDDESATSIESHNQVDEPPSHEGCNDLAPLEWARQYRPATPHNMLPTLHETHPTISVPPPTSPARTSMSKTPSRPHHTVKGLIGDIKRLGRKMRDHIFKAPGRRGEFAGRVVSDDGRIEHPANDHSWPLARHLEHGYYPRGSFETGRNSAPAGYVDHLPRSRPTTSNSFAGPMVTKQPSDVKNARRRTLPPMWGEGFDLLQAENLYQPRQRPASLVLGHSHSYANSIRRANGDWRPLDSIPGSPPTHSYDVYPPQSIPCGLYEEGRRHEPRGLPQRKFRWSTFSFLGRSSK